MTKADIIRMAIEAELICNEEGWCGWVEDTDLLPFIERFAELVRADEREANIGCIGRIAAMVVDPIDQARLYEAMDAIRARSNT